MFFYSVFDKAIQAYTRPFIMRSNGEALRSFMNEVLDNVESPMNRHPEDYGLFRLGTFDERTGMIVGEEPVCIARAHELVADKE